MILEKVVPRIKNVLDGSPAGLTGQLCTGDRILDVDGHDLRKASHDKAVDIIRQSGNTVTFVVQVIFDPLKVIDFFFKEMPYFVFHVIVTARL